jgi:hypothetical protein
MHVSNSEIQCFKRCRRKWWLAYYRKLRPAEEKVTGALKFGTRVHEAMAAYYSPTPQDPVEVIRNEFNAARDALTEDQYGQIEQLNKDAALALAMVEGYVEWVQETGVDDDYEVISVEEELAVEFDPLPVTIIGKLDTRIRRKSDGRYLSMDHKTCASFDGLTRTLELNEQPLMYQLLERMTLPEDQYVIGGVYNMLRKVKRGSSAKPPFYMREHVHHNDTELRNFWQRLFGTLSTMVDIERRLDAGESHYAVVYPTPTSTCAWDCEFRSVCPLFDDGSHAEGFIEAAYKVHNPYERYSEVTL